MAQITVGILGATAYTGVELVGMLARHPHVRIAFVSSRSYAGQHIASIFPELTAIFDDELIDIEGAQTKQVDCVFSCLPHAVSAKLCYPFFKNGVRVIDLSADFRIRDAQEYKMWYKTDHPHPELLSEAVFGLPEHYRTEVRTTNVLANPGCYPTSILLPLLPLMKDPSTQIQSVIADSKSGVSGAGRTLKLASHYVEANENLSAYSIGRQHRHTAEIDQELSRASGSPVKITFSPHLIPMSRGILSTIYITGNRNAAQCLEIVKEYYKEEPFVRVRTPGDLPKIRGVVHTNFCDISFTGGTDGQPVIAVSAIDNLLKGASGQALQNMNIMFDFEETAGLL
ncbi:MAG: N-acetyl-gamma-glutamyl-phosphate reductase [Chitinivibrionales bacterium]